MEFNSLSFRQNLVCAEIFNEAKTVQVVICNSLEEISVEICMTECHLQGICTARYFYLFFFKIAMHVIVEYGQSNSHFSFSSAWIDAFWPL